MKVFPLSNQKLFPVDDGLSRPSGNRMATRFPIVLDWSHPRHSLPPKYVYVANTTHTTTRPWFSFTMIVYRRRYCERGTFGVPVYSTSPIFWTFLLHGSRAPLSLTASSLLEKNLSLHHPIIAINLWHVPVVIVVVCIGFRKVKEKKKTRK